jgi:hypothetical protein
MIRTSIWRPRTSREPPALIRLDTAVYKVRTSRIRPLVLFSGLKKSQESSHYVGSMSKDPVTAKVAVNVNIAPRKMAVAMAKSTATTLVSAVQMLQSAMVAADQNNHECRLIVERLVNRAPAIRDLLKEAIHFEDKELNEGMARTLHFAVDAVREATMVVYKWLAKPPCRRIGSAIGSQPGLQNARERLSERMSELDDITAYRTRSIDRRAEQMVHIAQLAGRYQDISHIFEGLLLGRTLEISRDRTIAIAKAQVKQASKRGQSLRGHTGSVYSIAWSPIATKWPRRQVIRLGPSGTP